MKALPITGSVRVLGNSSNNNRASSTEIMRDKSIVVAPGKVIRKKKAIRGCKRTAAERLDELYQSKVENMLNIRLKKQLISDGNRFAILGDEIKLRSEIILGHKLNRRDSTTGMYMLVSLHSLLDLGFLVYDILLRFLCSWSFACIYTYVYTPAVTIVFEPTFYLFLGRTILHEACASGHFHIVRFLINEHHGNKRNPALNVNLPTMLGRSSPLHLGNY